MFNSKKLAYLMGITAILVTGCAKDKPYEAVYKSPDLMLKSDVPCAQKDSKCVAVISALDATRSSNDHIPYFLGDQKLVRVSFDSDSLDVNVIDKNENFRFNDTNEKSLLSIGVSYHDYRCAENANGECGNKEEENNEIEDEDKRYVKLKFDSKTHLKGLPYIPSLINSYVGCLAPQDARVVKHNVTKDGMDVIVEQDYLKTPGCIGFNDSLDDLNSTVKYHISIKDLNAVASPNYKTIHYGKQSDNTFGFFDTNRETLNVDNSMTQSSHKVYLNRFNPNKPEIVYYLSELFYDPEFSYIKAYTEKAVKTINNSLKSAGAGTQIVLKDGRGKDVGEIGNNFIVLVKDPNASGILGYGPTTQNPLTGETLSGRTVMYYGNLVTTIKRAYEDLRERQIEENAKKVRVEAGKGLPKRTAKLASSIKNAAKINTQFKFIKTRANLESNITTPVLSKRSFNQMKFLSKAHEFTFDKVSKLAMDKNNVLELDDYTRIQNLMNKDQQDMFKFDLMGKHSMYHESMADFSTYAYSSLNAGQLSQYQDNETKILRDWRTLESTEKEDIIRIIMPQVWNSTLVHEIGHNLGLRHNFNGSEDETNYYTRDEIANLNQSLGIDLDPENIPTYSSVMDYSANALNELNIMGKYDVAALRFGYAREVEDAAGNMVAINDSTENPLANTMEQKQIELRTYDYCTDEHVSVNAGCNRFDEGKSLKEVAQFWADKTRNLYKNRHFRKDSKDFSELDDVFGLMGSRNFFLRNLRLFFETYDRLSNMFFGETTQEGMEYVVQYFAQRGDQDTSDFIQDVIDSTTVAGDLYMELLTTPNVHCGVAQVKKGEENTDISELKINEYKLLSEINEDAVDCFAGDIQESFDSAYKAKKEELATKVTVSEGMQVIAAIVGGKKELDESENAKLIELFKKSIPELGDTATQELVLMLEIAGLSEQEVGMIAGVFGNEINEQIIAALMNILGAGTPDEAQTAQLKTIVANNGKVATQAIEEDKNLKLDVVVSTVGKHINNKKDRNATHRYTPYVDQIDVRGTWIEKYFAHDYLTKRKLNYSLFEESTGSFLDLTSYQEKYFKYLTGMINDSATVNAVETLKTGETRRVDIAHKPSTSNNLKGYGVNAINKMFGFTTGDNSLLKTYLENTKDRVLDGADNEFKSTFRNLFSIKTDLPNFADAKDYKKVEIAGETLLAHKSNQMALIAMDHYEKVNMLDQIAENEETAPLIQAVIDAASTTVEQANVENILAQEGTTEPASGNPAAANLPDNQIVTILKAIGPEYLKLYVEKKTPTADYSAKILNSLIRE